MSNFKSSIQLGIPEQLPEYVPLNKDFNNVPKRKEILKEEEKKLA